MAYKNSLMTELMVPRAPGVNERIHGFYDEIGWEAYDASDGEPFTYVHPRVSGEPPVIGYWQTQTERKTRRFVDNPSPEPSIYARGLILPELNELVEVCLVVPTSVDVREIFERGGRTLEQHTHVLPRMHADSLEFRFSDPFNYSLRVTADPGWEMPSSRRRSIGRRVRDLFST